MTLPNSTIQQFDNKYNRTENLERELWKKDCQARKLNKEDAIDRKRWRKQIRDD